MSTLLIPTLRNHRPIGQSAIGPYATALLARERAVLVEWVSPANRRTRRRGRLRAAARAGAELLVELNDAGDLPAAGTRVMLVVPVQNSLWRFTSVAEGDAALATSALGTVAGSLVVAWPTEVTQEAGRRFERANRMLPVSMAADGQRDARSVCTYTLDVSMGGLQVAVPTPLPIGASLQLAIRLPQETVEATATVAWSRTLRDEPGDPMYSAGLQFVSLAPRAATRLRMLLGTSGVAVS